MTSSTAMYVDPAQEQLALDGDWPESEEKIETLPPLAYPWSMPLGAAREVLLENLDEGAGCPCCGRHAQRYRRQINVEMARTLIALYRQHGRSWANLKDVRRGAKTSNREESKLRYWGLLEEEKTVRRDDGGRAGWWRVTERGERFALGNLAVPQYALEFHRKCVGFEGEMRTIEVALGKKFNLAELLGREGGHDGRADPDGPDAVAAT